MTVYADESPLPISLVAHTVFCGRRAWLESVGEVVDSVAMDTGTAAHLRVDQRVSDRDAARRSVSVGHADLGIGGRCDVVEQARDGSLRVVEYKASPVRRRPEVTEAQRIQLCLQGMSLEDMGHTVNSHAVYFTNHRTSVDVEVTDAVRARAIQYVAATRAIVNSASAPEPLLDDARCGRCSHVSVCLPDERGEERVRRRVVPSDPAGEVLHLTTPGSRASLKAGRVVVVRGEEELASLPVERVASLVVHGNVDLSSALIRELLWRTVPIVWASGSGRVIGHARSARSANGLQRVQQHVAAAHGRIDLARELIDAKVCNQATQLRRSSRADVLNDVKHIRRTGRACREATSLDELLGLEGEAASISFARFATMLVGEAGVKFASLWPGREGRGATDPVNVALNFAYGLLLSEVIAAVHACGLDPHAGFVHSSSRNKPALALDLMEQFRPPVADSVVITAINNGELAASAFSNALGDWRLRDSGRRSLVSAFQRRMQQEITHPVFGYRVTWRRVVEVQARMVLGVLDGSQPDYVGIRTR